MLRRDLRNVNEPDPPTCGETVNAAHTPFPGRRDDPSRRRGVFCPRPSRIGFGAPLHGRGTPGWVKTAANHASTYNIYPTKTNIHEKLLLQMPVTLMARLPDGRNRAVSVL